MRTIKLFLIFSLSIVFLMGCELETKVDETVKKAEENEGEASTLTNAEPKTGSSFLTFGNDEYIFTGYTDENHFSISIVGYHAILGPSHHAYNVFYKAKEGNIIKLPEHNIKLKITKVDPNNEVIGFEKAN